MGAKGSGRGQQGDDATASSAPADSTLVVSPGQSVRYGGKSYSPGSEVPFDPKVDAGDITNLKARGVLVARWVYDNKINAKPTSGAQGPQFETSEGPTVTTQ